MRTKTLEQHSAKDLAGLQVDILQKLRNGNMTWEQIDWFRNLTFEKREKLIRRQSKKALILKLISEAETLVLDAVDGTQTLATAEELFPSGIDSDFKSWGTNKAGIATKEIVVDVHELAKDTTFTQMFGSLGTNLDKLCLTQHQIKNFCKKHPNWLCQNKCATFFLFKVEDQFFIAYVHERHDGLDIHVYRFENDDVWVAGRSPHVVVPQLTA